jgi:alpha-1,3/alpha-1,6-mannosyltransferase
MLPMAGPPLRIAFLRPTLGIGGSERLIVDAAMELQQRGHAVTLFVPDRQEQRQLDEVVAGRLRIRTPGDFFPRHLAQRVRAPLAIARAAWAACHMAWQGPHDVIVCDVVSHVVPLLRRITRAKIVFYCNFPDALLTPPRAGLYRAYRWPLDRLEARGLAAAHRVLVNSHFTASTVRRTFPSLANLPLEVLHPGVEVMDEMGDPDPAQSLFLSVSRFDPLKNVPLAVEAVAVLRGLLPAETFASVNLVLAGHYDGRLAEQRATMNDLRARVARHGLGDHVRFALSPSDAERRILLARSVACIYTPVAEHYGLVPVEAMAAGRPVIAVNAGGPTETVLDGETGLLCAADPAAFAKAMRTLVVDRDRARRMGVAGRAHVVRSLSRAAFGARLDAIVRETVALP